MKMLRRISILLSQLLLLFMWATSGFAQTPESEYEFWALEVDGIELPRVVMWSPDGNSLAVVNSDNVASATVVIVDMPSGEVVNVFESQVDDPAVAWSPDAESLVYSRDYDHSHVLDINTGELRSEISAQRTTSFDWSPDGMTIFIVANSGGVEHRIVTSQNAETGGWLWTFNDNYQGAVGVALSPDGALVAAANWDASLSVWDTEGNDDFTILSAGGFYNIPPDFYTNQTISWSPDSERLAIFANDNASQSYVIRIWDIEKKELATELTGHENLITAVAWSPDGSKIATSSFDKTIRIWDANAYELLNVLEEHTGFVTSVSWNPDGTQLASADFDGQILIWQMADSEETQP